MLEFKLPELGENIDTGNVVKVTVSVGDTVTKDQTLIELETDKATLEVPSPAEGIIKEILVKEGEDIKVGQVIVKIEESAAAQPPAKEEKPPAKEAQQPAPAETPAKDSSRDTQVLVIGGGPGGYAAAFFAADLGMDTTLIDLDVNPGGVCLFRGCIPSKALLHAAKVLSESREAKNFGIEFEKPKIDLDKLRGWKESVVERLTGGLGQLCKQRKVNFIQGRATFLDSNTVEIEPVKGKKSQLTFSHAILATGSRPITLPFMPKSDRVLDSTSALNIENVPKSLLVVGGGYIGLELGTVYAELGSEVSVVEMLDGILPGADRDLANVLFKRIKEIFKSIMLSTKVMKAEESGGGIQITFEDKDGKKTTETYEKVLVSIGRIPNSNDIGLENTKIQIDEKGFVKVNAQRQTDDPSVFAIGDIAGEPMLAHKASHEGRVAVEAIAGHKVAFEPSAIPAVVFTDPEIAWCGLTETQAKEQNRKVEVAKFPWSASGRAITLDRTDGLTKLIIEPETERILGMAIVGVGAGELIAEGVLAVEMGSVASDLKLSIHPHPTISETIMESAESFFGHSTHIYRPKKK